MRTLFALSILLLFTLHSPAQTSVAKNISHNDAVGPAMVDLDSYEALIEEVKKHRQSRLVTLDQFVKMSQQPGVVILDTRSDSMYAARHIKGAIHLNFSDFNEKSLQQLIPDKNTIILIYCNNNFRDDDKFFPTKMVSPATREDKPLTLALNIPTYINLYGYGYRNVYELSQAISVSNSKIKMEGTEEN